MQQKLLGTLKNPIANPIILFLVCFLAYGIFLPGMGFYWDDWPWIWRAHVFGDGALLQIDAAFRPMAGVILWLGSKVAGENPLGWQIFNLLIRWLGGVSLWWAIQQIWPDRKTAGFWGAALFLVYPGFSQQFVSINSSRHIFPLIPFTLSLGFTARACYKEGKKWTSAGIAVALSALTMLTTEYYYGLEIARGVLLWILVKPRDEGNRAKLGAWFKTWAPYLILLISIFSWRYAVSHQINYQASLVGRLTRSPLITILNLFKTSLSDFLETSIVVLIDLFRFPQPGVFGPRKTLLFWGLVALSAGSLFIYSSLTGGEGKGRKWNQQALILGIFALWISGLPFWITGLEVKLSFPNDRLTLPMMLGVSLVLTALLDLLKSRVTKNVTLALVVGLSIGHHYQNAVSYQHDWEVASAFFQQLSWRVPGLAPGTALLSLELPIEYTTDNSLTAPLNWRYSDNAPHNTLPYGMIYLEQRLGTIIPSLEENTPIKQGYGYGSFLGSSSQTIAFRYEPPACVHILDPKYDRHYPGTNEILEDAILLSDPRFIQVNGESPSLLPGGSSASPVPPEKQWCYYYQRASLARQYGDWEQVAALGDIAFTLEDSPNLAAERVPFIEGYANIGDWETAIEQTLTTIEIDKWMGPMLCDTWERVIRANSFSEIQMATIRVVNRELDCGFGP